jgi:hypothetical protein
VQQNPRTPIRTQLGGTLNINLVVVRPNGTLVNFTSSYSFVMTIKSRPQDVPSKATLTGTLTPGVAPNAVTFALSHSTTKTWQPGRYVYDIVMTDPAGNRDAVVPLSSIYFEAAVTPPV